MAFDVTTLFTTVYGNKRVVALDVTADAASGAVTTGLSVVDAVTMGPISCATAAFKIKINQNSAATALNGSLFVSSAADGDNFYIVAHGR